MEDCFHLGLKALIHNRSGKLLLLQKNSKTKELLWDLPGGRIQKNESFEEALRREVYEETGLENITRMDPLTMVLSRSRIPLQDRDVGLILAVYLCDVIDDASVIRLSNEHLHYDWFKPAEAAALLAVNHPAALTDAIARL